MVISTMREGAKRRSRRLEELYERHAQAAVRLAFLITLDRELSRDIVQDAFVRVAGRVRHIRFPDAFEAYLRQTVVNLCTSHFRHERIARAYVERESRQPGPVEEPPDLGTRDELRRALKRPPARQRAALFLRYYEDLQEGQVAAALGGSV